MYWYNHGSKTALVFFYYCGFNPYRVSIQSCVLLNILFDVPSYDCFHSFDDFSTKIPAIKSINAPSQIVWKRVELFTVKQREILWNKNHKNVYHYVVQQRYSICSVACLFSRKKDNWLQVMNFWCNETHESFLLNMNKYCLLNWIILVRKLLGKVTVYVESK